MKKVKLFEAFVTESTVNLHADRQREIQTVIDLLTKDPAIQQVDEGYVELTTPFEIHKDIKNEAYKNTLGIVIYYELLSYAYNYKDEKQIASLTPWVAMRITLENEDTEFTKEMADFLKEKIETTTSLKLFMDEDATFMHWSKNPRGGYTEYTCYVNPDLADGWWENHTL
jgi:hypothetical protein